MQDQLQRRRKSWWYLMRLRNSEWFRALPPIEQQAVIMAAELDAHASVAKFRAVLTFSYLAIVCVAAFAFWGLALTRTALSAAEIGAVIGCVLGYITATPIARAETPEHAKDLQFAAGASWGNLGLLIGVAGLLVWVIRSVLP